MSEENKLGNILKEISRSMTLVEAEKEAQKDLMDIMKEELESMGHNKKLASRLVKTYHNQTIGEQRNDLEEIEQMLSNANLLGE